MNPKSRYEELKSASSRRLSLLKSELLRLSIFRLLAFLSTGFAVYLLWQEEAVAGIAFLVGLAIFLFLVWLHANKKEALDYEKRYQAIATEALAILSGKWRDRDPGTDLAIPDHPFTSDLNVFGRHSLFQFINRTESATARRILGQWLGTNLTNPEAIANEREIVADFARDPDWVLRFLAHARSVNSGDENLESVRHWSSEPEFENSKIFWFFSTRVLPVVMAIAAISLVLGYLQWSAFLWLAVIPGFFIVRLLKRHQDRFQRFTALLYGVAANEGMLAMLRNRDFEGSPFRKMLDKAHLKGSTEGIRKLKSIVGAIESRNNIVVSIALNLILAWDYQCARRLHAWKSEYGDQIFYWLELTRTAEAYLSFATYHFNHPHFRQADLCENGEVEMVYVRHPLMDENAVPNDLDLTVDRRFFIITGANMAGKSTYLRTIGLNLLLAMRGLPVFAERLSLAPMRLYTSMLTSDSLGDHESYFFSELKRLRLMTDALESGEPHFVILDEILKGTNSVDKAEGSKQFLRKLMSLPAKGLIATHDLSLCNIIEEFPQSVINQRFEVGFVDNELSFDYKLQPGVCKNMNASFLLRKMGLVID